MDLIKFEIRCLLKYYWKQDNSRGSKNTVCEVEGEGIVRESAAQRLFQRLNTEKKNTKDLPRSGKPKLWDIENIHRGLEENLQKILVGYQKNFVK